MKRIAFTILTILGTALGSTACIGPVKVAPVTV